MAGGVVTNGCTFAHPTACFGTGYLPSKTRSPHRYLYFSVAVTIPHPFVFRVSALVELSIADGANVCNNIDVDDSKARFKQTPALYRCRLWYIYGNVVSLKGSIEAQSVTTNFL